MCVVGDKDSEFFPKEKFAKFFEEYEKSFLTEKLANIMKKMLLISENSEVHNDF